MRSKAGRWKLSAPVRHAKQSGGFAMAHGRGAGGGHRGGTDCGRRALPPVDTVAGEAHQRNQPGKSVAKPCLRRADAHAAPHGGAKPALGNADAGNRRAARGTGNDHRPYERGTAHSGCASPRAFDERQRACHSAHGTACGWKNAALRVQPVADAAGHGGKGHRGGRRARGYECGRTRIPAHGQHRAP